MAVERMQTSIVDRFDWAKAELPSRNEWKGGEGRLERGRKAKGRTY